MLKKYCDLIYKLIVAISLEYVLFFGMEAILPGIVMDVFNINILLVLVVILLGILLGVKKCQGVFREDGQNRLLRVATIVMVLFLLLVMAFVLHKLSLIWILIYMVISLIVANLFRKNI